MKELLGKRISELHTLLSTKKVKAQEIAEAHIKHAKKHEPALCAYNTFTEELAFASAQNVDKSIEAKKPLSKLAGIPVAVKDNICLANYPTTCSSKILENFNPPYQATVVERLLASGALIIGKTNMDEFAMGSSTENSAFKITRNPWNTKKVPGGSSGGSACAVASHSAVLALGSDTGGSIRQPASFCGLAGMKPTYGTVSRFGLVAFASSLDQIGPLARTTEDLVLLLSVISGHDVKDSTSCQESLPDLLAAIRNPIKGLKIGVIKELLVEEGIDKEVRHAILQAQETFKSLGATVVEVSMPHLKHALAVYYIIATAESSANLARFDGVRYGLRIEAPDITSMYCATRQAGFGQEVKRRIMLGTYALSSGYYNAYYKKAQQVRRLIKNEFDARFKEVDLLITPTSPTVAFDVGAKIDDPLTMYLSDIATIPANLTGIPGISIPCGFNKDNLPIGLQILAPTGADSLVLQAAHAFEQATDFHKKYPEMENLK